MNAIRTPFCGHCKNIGKKYTTHFTRKTPSSTSELVCPELLKKVCTDCKGRNHTSDKCPKLSVNVPRHVKNVVVPKKKIVNKYEALIIDDDEVPVIQETMSEYGELLYAVISQHWPYRAGKITGMFLELDVEEINELLVNHVALKERVNEANEILDREYPQGYVDPIFEIACIHTRSSANDYDNTYIDLFDF